MVRKCDGVIGFHGDELCSNWLSMRASWGLVNGPAEVQSLNVMPQACLPGFAAQVRYVSITARVKEGSKVVPNRGAGAKPHEIGCGMAVEAVFEKLSDQVALPKYRPCISS